MNGKPDRIYLLIEDDEFPFKHECIKTINVSNQEYFPPSGLNTNCQWSYMTMMRTVYCKYLKESRVLSLDCDTIINGNIDELWNLDLKDNYCAGGREPDKSMNDLYINVGVTMFNLKKMREIVDKVVDALNTRVYAFPDQDAINEFCRGHILEIDPKFNCHPWSVPSDEKVIIHYAGNQHWAHLPLPEKYEKMEV